MCFSGSPAVALLPQLFPVHSVVRKAQIAKARGGGDPSTLGVEKRRGRRGCDVLTATPASAGSRRELSAEVQLLVRLSETGRLDVLC